MKSRWVTIDNESKKEKRHRSKNHLPGSEHCGRNLNRTLFKDDI